MSILLKVVVLGFGVMGYVFVSNLLKNGFIVVGWNCLLVCGEDLQVYGLFLYVMLQQVVVDVEVIISMFVDGEVIFEVLV